MKTILIIILLLITGLLNTVYSCSPYFVPNLIRQQIIGTKLVLDWQSTSSQANTCIYNINTEILCANGNVIFAQTSIGTAGAGQTYPSDSVDISNLCIGETYFFRAREQSSAWTTLTPFTVGNIPFDVNITPSIPPTQGNPNTRICIGDCIDLNAIVPPTCNPVSLTWSNALGILSSVNVCPTVTTTYTVTATTNGICGPINKTNSITIEVVKYPVGGNSTSYPEHVCEGDPSEIKLTNYVGNIQWQSSFSDTGPWNNIPGEILPNHVPISTMVDVYYRAELSNFCGLENSSIAVVYAEPFPNLNINVPDGCIYNPVQFNNSSSIATGNVVNWEWDFGDLSSAFTENTEHQYGSPNTYNISLTATSDYNCVSNIQSQVTVYPSPKALFSANPDCEYNDIEFVNYSSVVAPDQITNTIYDFGDLSPLSNLSNPSHNYNRGNYNARLIVSTNNGCTDDISLPIEVYPEPIASFDASTVCENGLPTAFNNLSTVDNGQLILSNWSFGDGNTSTFTNPNHNYDNDDLYNVTLTVLTNKNCENSITTPITVLKKPETSFFADAPESCSPLCVNFSDMSLANATNITSYIWSFGDGQTSNSQNPSLCFYNDSKTDDIELDVELITTNDFGCKDTLTLIDYLNVWHNPVSIFEVEPSDTNMYYPTIPFINQSIGGNEYIWEFGDGEFTYNYEPTHIYPDTGTYTVQQVTITDKNCKDTSYNDIKIKPVVNIYIPNAFTPDGDGDNDEFIFKNYGIIKENYNFYIYDRWGTLLYYTNNIERGWDGTHKGVLLKQDTYIYKLDCVDVYGKRYEEKGHVTLIR